MAVTQSRVIQALKEFHKGIGYVTFRRYIYELLEALDDEQLLILIENADGLPGIRIKAMQILEKRKHKETGDRYPF